MNKNDIPVKKILLIVCCFAIAFSIRVFPIISGEATVTDERQYFALATVPEEAEPVMTSGVAFAYTESLSRILRFMGNSLPAVAWYHVVLQAASFIFLYFGCSFLFGRKAALLVTICFAISPWMIKGIFEATPECFYLFWWSFLFFLVGIFTEKTRKTGWYRRNVDEIYLVTVGFVAGVLCIWHWMGFLMLLLIAYSVIGNMYLSVGKRRIWKKANLLESLLGEEDEAEPRKEVMPVSSQITILSGGVFLGGYCTLMKYTGVTGEYLKGQFQWWMGQILLFEDGRAQDLRIWLPLWIMIVLSAGLAVEMVIKKIPKKEVPVTMDNTMDSTKEIMAEEKSETKKVKYLDNPLPLPKKHVKRKLDFAIDDKDDFVIDDKDDFDIDIDANDDFDV